MEENNMKRCKTKYPVLLLHGLNCQDETPIAYWGRIPSALRAHGAAVYFGGQDAWGTIRDNAEQIKNQIETILVQTNCDKVNVIAHSKGGLEARFLISSLHLGETVASLTTISTPHHGVKTLSLWQHHKILIKLGCPIMNCIWRILGDQRPNAEQVLKELTAPFMKVFNQENLDDPQIFYQSWGVALQDGRDDLGMMLFRKLFIPADGENDGLVSPESAKWTNYQGTIGKISHQDIVDCRQKNLNHFNVIEFYCNIVSDLAVRGL